MRIQLELPEDKVREIDSLMADAGISTRKLYIEYALATLKWALDQARDDRIIAALNESTNSFIAGSGDGYGQLVHMQAFSISLD